MVRARPVCGAAGGHQAAPTGRRWDQARSRNTAAAAAARAAATAIAAICQPGMPPAWTTWITVRGAGRAGAVAFSPTGIGLAPANAAGVAATQASRLAPAAVRTAEIRRTRAATGEWGRRDISADIVSPGALRAGVSGPADPDSRRSLWVRQRADYPFSGGALGGVGLPTDG